MNLTPDTLDEVQRLKEAFERLLSVHKNKLEQVLTERDEARKEALELNEAFLDQVGLVKEVCTERDDLAARVAELESAGKCLENQDRIADLEAEVAVRRAELADLLPELDAMQLVNTQLTRERYSLAARVAELESEHEHCKDLSDAWNRIADLESALDRWRVLAQALDKLCAYYRLGKRPSERLLTTIKVTRSALATVKGAP